MTRVRPSSTVHPESSSAKDRRAGRSSCGPRPSMRCPSLSAFAGQGGRQRGCCLSASRRRRNGGSSVAAARAAAPAAMHATLRRGIPAPWMRQNAYLDDELPLVVGQGLVGVPLQGAKAPGHGCLPRQWWDSLAAMCDVRGAPNKARRRVELRLERGGAAMRRASVRWHAVAMQSCDGCPISSFSALGKALPMQPSMQRT